MKTFAPNRPVSRYLPLLLLLPAALALTGTPAARAQNPAAGAAAAKAAPGSLTGTITNEKHQPVTNAHALLASGVVVIAEPQQTSGIRNPDANGQGVFGAGETPGVRVASDPAAGGLYTLDKLKPGVYNITVEAGQISQTHYRPERIMGVVIRSGQPTTLDIVLHEGDTLEESGPPTVTPILAKYGWLEGTVVTPDGKPVLSARALLATGVTITISNGSGKLGGIKTDHMAGGFFSIESMHVGTYSFLIEAGQIGTTRYHPQQIQNIVVKPGIRTLLTIVVPEGIELQRLGTPPVKLQPLTRATDPASVAAR